MLAPSYRPNTPHIIHETIHGEVILVNMLNGSYYSTDQTGTFIWNHLQNGVSTDQLVILVTAEYSGEPSEIREQVFQHLTQLEQEGLILPADSAPPAPTPAASMQTGAEKRPFVAPTLAKYTEMEDLLLLDPIHDVDESGWPKRTSDSPSPSPKKRGEN